MSGGLHGDDRPLYGDDRPLGVKRQMFTDPERELVQDAIRQGVDEFLPDDVASDAASHLGVFSRPGLRFLTYVRVDGDPWAINASLADAASYIDGENPGGSVDIIPFGQPVEAYWSPEGSDGGGITLALHRAQAGAREYVAVPRTPSDTDGDVRVPHVLVGVLHVPERDQLPFDPRSMSEEFALSNLERLEDFSQDELVRLRKTERYTENRHRVIERLETEIERRVQEDDFGYGGQE